MRYALLALVPLLLVGCGGSGSRRGPSSPPPPATSTQQPREVPQGASQAQSMSADVSRPQTGADCARQLQEQGGRVGRTVSNVQIQATPTGFSCTGQLGGTRR
jgi:hypothetical protein